jgi:hypothetical protein
MLRKRRSRRARSFAADDGHAELARSSPQAGVERLHLYDVRFRRRRERNEGVLGDAAHGCDIADRAAECFPADTARILLREEMDAFDHCVGLQKQPARIPGATDHRAVIASGHEDIVAQRQAARERRHEAILAELGKLHVAGAVAWT